MESTLLNFLKNFYFHNAPKNQKSKVNKIIIISRLSLILFLIFYFIDNAKSFSSDKKQREQTKEKEIKKKIKAINETKSSNETEIKKEYNSNSTLCMCVVAKRENRYIREFVEYYKKMKVDKIFLYDNNEENGETFDEVLSDYIKDG